MDVPNISATTRGVQRSTAYMTASLRNPHENGDDKSDASDSSAHPHSILKLLPAVKSPLGFFALVAVVVGMKGECDQTYSLYGVSALSVLILIVAILTVLNAKALQGHPEPPSEALYKDLIKQASKTINQHVRFVSECETEKIERLKKQVAELIEENQTLKAEKEKLSEFLELYMHGAKDREEF
jgi:hypothetical protein